METITTDEWYSIQGIINGKLQYVDHDGYLYDLPAQSKVYCATKAQAIHNLKWIKEHHYPNVNLRIVKVKEQYKITKR